MHVADVVSNTSADWSIALTNEHCCCISLVTYILLCKLVSRDIDRDWFQTQFIEIEIKLPSIYLNILGETTYCSFDIVHIRNKETCL